MSMQSRTPKYRLAALGRSMIPLTRSSVFPAFMVLCATVAANMLLQPTFFRFHILRSNLMTFTPLLLIAMAQGIIMLSGSIDLSAGATITLLNVVMASLMTDGSASILGTALLAVVLGVALSLFNGLFIGLLRLPAMMVTFAAAAIWRGLSLMIMPQPGGYVSPNFYRLYQANLLGFLPAPLLLLGIAGLMWFLIRRRRLYRHLYAVGGLEANAWSSGIPVTRVKLSAFVLSGVLYGLAALSVTAQAASGDANLAHAYTLPSVAACVIGGISLGGGKGKLAGAIVGGLIFGFLTNVIFFARIPSLYQDLIKGLIIIIALGAGTLPQLLRKGVRIGRTA